MLLSCASRGGLPLGLMVSYQGYLAFKNPAPTFEIFVDRLWRGGLVELVGLYIPLDTFWRQILWGSRPKLSLLKKVGHLKRNLVLLGAG